MIYLKPLANRLIKDEGLLKEALQKNSDEEMLKYLLDLFSESNIEHAFNQHYGIRYSRLTLDQVDTTLLDSFNKESLRRQTVIPYHFDEAGSIWYFAIGNLVDRDIRKTITKFTKANNQKAIFRFSFEHEIEEVYEQIEANPVKKARSVSSGVQSVPETTVVDGNFNASDWVDNVVRKGIDLGASDIHIEKLETQIQIRYRVDGVMTGTKRFTFDDSEVSNIYVRLKIISNMDMVEKRKPQDGRINDYEYAGDLYDLRVSSVSTVYGEKFVMRVFNRSESIPKFHDLGFSETDIEKVKKMLGEKNGIVYLAGATGSGKTTTLYTMIEHLDKDSMNIYTIESPVEKTLENVNQIQIDEAGGVTYPETLKALLRQDPDVIVVGEIRDPETAELSIRASLTGHLVLTTIHANSALESLGRLIDMGIDDYLVGASSVGFLSQRLTRKLCVHCKRKVEVLDKYEEDWIKEADPDFDYEKMKASGKYIYEAQGCDKCIDGYDGRVALMESVVVDKGLKSLITKGSSIDEINEYVSSDPKNNSLKEDGIIKLKEGIIDMKQLLSQL